MYPSGQYTSVERGFWHLELWAEEGGAWEESTPTTCFLSSGLVPGSCQVAPFGGTPK